MSASEIKAICNEVAKKYSEKIIKKYIKQCESKPNYYEREIKILNSMKTIKVVEIKDGLSDAEHDVFFNIPKDLYNSAIGLMIEDNLADLIGREKSVSKYYKVISEDYPGIMFMRK